MIYNTVLVSGIQQSDSVIHIHASTLFQILFEFRLLQSIEPSSMQYPVGLYWLSILNTAVCTCQPQTPNLKHQSVQPLSLLQRFRTPWTVAYQAPLSMGFSRREYWSGVCISIYNINSQTRLTGQHREIHSMFYDNLYEKRI